LVALPVNALSDILLTNSYEERQNRKYDLENTFFDQGLIQASSKQKCTTVDDDAHSTRSSRSQNSLFSATMYAGCSQHSSDLRVEASCDVGVNYNGINEELTLDSGNKGKFKIQNEFICHGAWQMSIERSNIMALQKQQTRPNSHNKGRSEHQQQQNMDFDTQRVRGSRRRPYDQEARIQQLTGYNNNRPQEHKTDILVLSTNSFNGHQHIDTVRKTQTITCLSYTEMDDGTLLAKVGKDACHDFVGKDDYANNDVIRLNNNQRSRLPLFNISSSGPCLQALTGSATKSALHSTSQNKYAFVMSYLIALTFASTSLLSKVF
jgi:hypothetical protein